jgi:hypothetical protein
MKPYVSKSGAWVQFETIEHSGMYKVTLYAPDDNVHDRVRCDDYRDALAYRRSFINIAKNWG